MSNKTIYVAAGVLMVAIAAFFIGKIFFAGNAGQKSAARVSENAPAPEPLSKVASVPAGDALIIGTARGAVSVKNFYASAAGATEQFIVMKKNGSEEITYDTYTSGFSVFISAAPFEANRAAAESNFLEILEITKVDACKLNVWVGVPVSVDPAFAGRNLGLSFCAGMIQ